MSRVDAILARLGTLYPKAIDLSLDRIRGFMRRLGDPQDHLPPVIHVAGTNGKGSTTALLRSCLEAAGYRVHVYTSPHLVRFAERIRLAGNLIDDTNLSELLCEVERFNKGDPITVFEVTTAAAFLAFSRVPADIVLLETGLGGRLDATNLVASPAVTAITPISLDHMSFLGNTVPQIAAEKAGILKHSRPAVIGRQSPAAAAVIQQRSEALGAPLFRHGVEWNAEPISAGWCFSDMRMRLDLPLPALPGRHQIDNAGTAVCCLQLLEGFVVDRAALARGMYEVEWPGRLQRLDFGSLIADLGAGWEIWLDGGHNPGAAEVLAEVVATWSDKPLYLVLGMLSNRDPLDFVTPLVPHVAAIETVAIPGEDNSYSALSCAASLSGLGIPVRAADSVEDAVAAIRRATRHQAGRILICGSLYLVGHVLASHAPPT